MALSDKFELTLNAWNQMVDTGSCLGGVRAVIRDSWQRCYYEGVSHEDKPSATITDMAGHLKEQCHLLSIATSIIMTMYPAIESSGFNILLCDAQGIILRIYTADDNSAHLSGHLSPGVDMSEIKLGTNSIALALLSGEPVQVSGPEHYNACLHGSTCAAELIRGSDRKVVGAIGICGPYQLVHEHTLGMVISLAKAIEKEICLLETRQHMALLDEFFVENTNIEDGLIAFDENGALVKINATAVDMLGTNFNEIEKELFDTIFAGANYSGYLKDIKGPAVKKTRLEAKVGQDTVAFQIEMRILWDRRFLGCICRLKSCQKWDDKKRSKETRYSFADIIGKDVDFHNSIYLAKQAAKSDSRILLQGESGTGKEVFAQSIHNFSSRRNGPFVAINCGAIPKELLESELFGYEEGAFTGARRGGQKGKFELAQGGTLFLDEIGELPYEMQAKLLRVLEEKKMRRVGGTKIINLDCRVISSTNRNLLDEVREKRFRDDLYYRLGVITIYIPPLRKRSSDLAHLINHFMHRISKDLRCRPAEISDEVMQKFYRYHWPGNIRELENIIERCLLLSGGETIKLEHLPLEIRELPGFAEKGAMMESDKHMPSMLPLKEIERKAIATTLHKTRGKIATAAKILGIGRNTLYRKIEKYKINVV